MSSNAFSLGLVFTLAACGGALNPIVGAADGGRDGATRDAMADGLAADATGHARDDGSSPWQLLFELHTTSVDPGTFSAGAQKIGLELRWELGDGTIVDANEVNHVYTQTGDKTVRVLSRDGLLGLTGLDLAANRLVGSIPQELAQLTNLQTLDLSSNTLAGTIPPEFAQLASLTKLFLSTNQLTGYVPDTFAELTRIDTIFLGENQLDETAVNAIINDIYLGRRANTNPLTKILNIKGGNAAPSPAALAQVNELIANHLWNIAYTNP